MASLTQLQLVTVDIDGDQILEVGSAIEPIANTEEESVNRHEAGRCRPRYPRLAQGDGL